KYPPASAWKKFSVLVPDRRTVPRRRASQDCKLMTTPKIDWRRVTARMWAAQSRADLNERPRLLLAWLIYGTVECGRTQIMVPDMTELFAQLHIGKNHHREVRVA